MVLMASYFTYLLKYVSSYGDEFLTLTRAYRGEDYLSTQEIKKDLIKAIEAGQSKLDADEGIKRLLSDVLVALKDIPSS